MANEFSPAPELPVLVIGAAGVDIVGRLRSELQPRTSIPARIRTSFGGVARNVAENLARLGQPVNLISVVGEDTTGERLLEKTRAAGVNVEAVLRTSEHPTGSYLAVVNDVGELQFGLDDMRPIATLTPEYLRQQEVLFHEASVLFLDANLPKDALRTAISLAKKARLPVVADPTTRTLASRLLPYLNRLRMLVLSSDEASAICGITFNQTSRRETLEVVRCLLGHGIEIVVITLGQNGVAYANFEASGHVPAIRTQVVDPTGAGDALTAAVLFALLNDIPIDDAVRLGVAAASLTFGYPGAVVPDLSLEKLYDQLTV